MERFKDVKICGLYYSDDTKALYVVDATKEMIDAVNEIRKGKGFTDLVSENEKPGLHYNFTLFEDLEVCEVGLCGYVVNSENDDGEPYDIQLTDKEKENLAWKLIEYMQMIINRQSERR